MAEEKNKNKNIEKREISTELEESYLDYAMSVIVSRALPDVRDGLKPVQRRILWAMWDSGVTHSAKLRKSANVVGEVLGRYHPHSDTAVYDTIARMAQDFSLRYPLIEGQGNWGSIDGDSPAAMRYTECRLSKISEEILFDIEKETVDWQPNYDATRVEPKVLPAKLPNLLLNGAIGIAVGMATNIPPHNLGELVDAILHLIDNSKSSSHDLMEFIQGPDFPTGGVIFDKRAIADAYSSGRGPITCRGVADITEKKGGKGFNIEITEIPYQVNKAELVTKIAELVEAKKIEGIRDIRDESNKEGLLITIELKSDASPQKILNQLYQFTDLQKDFHLNMIGLTGGIQPELLSLKDILAAYIEHRKVVVKRRAEFDLKKAEERAHILMGLSKALSAIDKVIATIKKSKDREDAQRNLIKNFKLTQIQANAILEMKLSTLAALERQRIEDELKEKKKLIEELRILLKSPAKILKVIKEETQELKNKYSDDRRTKVIVHGLKEFKEEDLVPQENVVITLSKSGYIKRLPPTTFKSQERGGKGLIGSEVGEEDFLMHFIAAKTHDNILFFTDRGRVFQTKVYEIPQAGRTAKGKPIHGFLEISADENISALIAYPADKKDIHLAMVTKNGMIKKTALSDFENIRRTGIIAISLSKGDLLKWVELVETGDEIILTTHNGQAIRFKEKDVRSMGRTAAGVRAIKLKKEEDGVSSMDIVAAAKIKSPKSKLLVVMANGFGKQTPISEYKVQKRGGSGIKTAKVTAKTGSVVAAHLIEEEEELLALSTKGQIIRTKLSSIRVASRATSGVRIMKIGEGDKIAGIVIL